MGRTTKVIDLSNGAPRPQRVYVEFDKVELALRLAEAVMERERPEGMSAAEAFSTLKNGPRLLDLAGVAIDYFTERMAAGLKAT